jgi:hypothetical protein
MQCNFVLNVTIVNKAYRLRQNVGNVYLKKTS